MAVAASYSFSVLRSTVNPHGSTSSYPPRLATRPSSIGILALKATGPKKIRNLKRGPSPHHCKSNAEKDTVLQKPNSDAISAKGDTRSPQPAALKSVGTQRRDKKEFQFDSREQQIEPEDLHDTTFLNAVVKVYCTHTAPNYSLPWERQRQYTSTGRAFMIGNGKLLTNAHCVEHGAQVKLKRRGDYTKYVAKVLARGVDCDIALLSVESEEFWKGVEPLHFGCLPRLQDAVTVVGYPLGGDTISVTKGVVSRIEVTSYAHGSSDLLSIQIDAAINPGNSGGPAFNEQGECIGVAFQVYRSEEAENIGYVIPTTVVSHFLNDYEQNGMYTGFPSLGVLLQKLENPALRACLKVPSKQGVLVRRVEPTSDANNVLKEGDVIVSFDNVRVGCEGTVHFRSTEITWLAHLRDIGVALNNAPVLHCDNLSAIHMIVNVVFHSRTKHVKIDYHFVREKVALGHLITRFVNSTSQLANILTKPLTRDNFHQLRSKLGLMSLPPPNLRGSNKVSTYHSHGNALTREDHCVEP